MEININLKDLWVKSEIEDGYILFKPKHMASHIDWSNISEIKSLCLPYIITKYNKEKIISLEASAGCIRALPIYYIICGDACLITDSALKIIKKYNITDFNERAVVEFLSFGFTLSDKTLINNIRCLQAGELLTYDNSSVQVRTNYMFNICDTEDKSKEDYTREFKVITEEIFHDLIKSLKNKTAVVPISAGYDSRFILAMLYMGGVRDVLTYSWGIPNNDDIIIGRAVARKLNYKWHAINHNIDTWKLIFNSDWFYKCLEYVTNYVSISGSASLPFVKQLMENYGYNENHDFVIIPGHTGDFISGGHLPLELNSNSDINHIIKSILKKHCYITGNIVPEQINLELLNQIDQYLKYLNNLDLWRLYELWEWRERQAKFIANANRYYEFAGFSWSMPFWDVRYIDFWGGMTRLLKYNQKFYKGYLEDNIFTPLGINYKKKDKKERQSFLRAMIRNNRIAANIVQSFKATGMINKVVKSNIYGFDTAFPLLIELAKVNFKNSYRDVCDYKKKMGHEFKKNNPYSYLSEFALTILIEQVHKLEEKNFK